MNFKKYHESKNLFDKDSNTINNNGQIRPGVDVPAGIYSISNGTTNWVYYRVGVQGTTRQISAGSKAENVNASDTLYVWRDATIRQDGVMLNEGGTALPYEPYGDTWHDIPHYVHKTDTDTLTTLPAVLYANDITATVGLKGQAVQSTTPTPQNPVMPQGTGERTENLFDWNWLVNGYHLDPQTGLPTTHQRRVSILQPIDVSQLTTATISYESMNIETLYAMYSVLTTENTLIRRGVNVASGSTLDLSGGDKLYIAFYNGASSDATAITKDNITNIMLNTGSTALPYEPYGFEISISSADTTTPIYLGEVETTRNIVRYEFTGKENWIRESGNTYALEGVEQTATGYANALCTHYVLAKSYSTLTGTDGTFSISRRPALFIHDENFTTAAQLKTYLATQYANGTPVIFYYALNTPETAVVNEPLMRIGNYADEVSGITIPVTAGGDTLSVDTTVQPSEVTVNYKGWHPVADVHERDNGAWT